MRNFFTLQFNTRIFNPDRTINSFSKEITDKKVLHKAPDRCVGTIMNFARSYRVEETKTTGKVEIILN